jgi:hypothetical protein
MEICTNFANAIVRPKDQDKFLVALRQLTDVAKGPAHLSAASGGDVVSFEETLKSTNHLSLFSALVAGHTQDEHRTVAELRPGIGTTGPTAKSQMKRKRDVRREELSNLYRSKKDGIR